LQGRVGIVTGGGKGIGASAAELLAGDGLSLALVGRDEAVLRSRCELISNSHPEAELCPVGCDVTDEEQVAAMTALVASRFGRIDILVNAAGGTGPIETPAVDYQAEDFMAILRLNVLGTFLPSKHVIPHMVAAGGGRIVNVAGTSGLRGYPNRSGYSASKWAVRGLTRTLALELGRHGITVNDVCPNVTHGARMENIVRVKAEKTGRTEEEVYADFATQTALGRFVEEQDVAAAIHFLCSESARSITGHDLPVDAGWDV
jgi:3-oxoacyl-[acyl-carrier protein] reductase